MGERITRWFGINYADAEREEIDRMYRYYGFHLWAGHPDNSTLLRHTESPKDEPSEFRGWAC